MTNWKTNFDDKKAILTTDKNHTTADLQADTLSLCNYTVIHNERAKVLYRKYILETNYYWTIEILV